MQLRVVSAVHAKVVHRFHNTKEAATAKKLYASNLRLLTQSQYLCHQLLVLIQVFVIFFEFN